MINYAEGLYLIKHSLLFLVTQRNFEKVILIQETERVLLVTVVKEVNETFMYLQDSFVTTQIKC